MIGKVQAQIPFLVTDILCDLKLEEITRRMSTIREKAKSLEFLCSGAALTIATVTTAAEALLSLSEESWWTKNRLDAAIILLMSFTDSGPGILLESLSQHHSHQRLSSADTRMVSVVTFVEETYQFIATESAYPYFL
jgi:uncharacterized membrane protein